MMLMKERPDYSGGYSLLSDYKVAAAEQNFWQGLGSEFVFSASFPIEYIRFLKLMMWGF